VRLVSAYHYHIQIHFLPILLLGNYGETLYQTPRLQLVISSTLHLALHGYSEFQTWGHQRGLTSNRCHTCHCSSSSPSIPVLHLRKSSGSYRPLEYIIMIIPYDIYLTIESQSRAKQTPIILHHHSHQPTTRPLVYYS